MAEMDVSQSSADKRHKSTKGKKQSTRVDLTPMVDLGFLLITFFMLTTTLQRPKTMDLYLPKDVKDQQQQNKVKESQALTILLGKDNKVYYYEGIGENVSKDPVHNLKVTTYALQGGIGDEIANKWKSVIQNSGGKDSMVVIIKPTSDATYDNLVTILDDMNIYEVKKYALVDISDNDKKMIQMKDAAGPTQ